MPGTDEVTLAAVFVMDIHEKKMETNPIAPPSASPQPPGFRLSRSMTSLRPLATPVRITRP